MMIELDLGVDAPRVGAEVKSNIDAITTLPDRDGEADHPRADEPGHRWSRRIGQAYRGAEFGDLVLWTGADGSVATVVDGFEEPGRSSDERRTASATWSNGIDRRRHHDRDRRSGAVGAGPAFRFMASIEASVTMPQGAPVEATAEAVAKLEDLARAEGRVVDAPPRS